MSLDETLAEPHAALGFVKNGYDWDWQGAEREFKRSIELDPNYATARYWYSIHLTATARLEEAVSEARRAQEADPVSLMLSTATAQALYFARRNDQAIEQLLKTLEVDPSFYMAHWWLAMVFEQAGRHEEAIAEAQKAMSLHTGAPAALGVLGNAYAVAGKRVQAQKVLSELKDLSRRRYVAPLDLALIHVGLGNKAQALEYLERAYEDHSDRLWGIKVWPQFDSLHGEARFQELLRRMCCIYGMWNKPHVLCFC